MKKKTEQTQEDQISNQQPSENMEVQLSNLLAQNSTLKELMNLKDQSYFRLALLQTLDRIASEIPAQILAIKELLENYLKENETPATEESKN